MSRRQGVAQQQEMQYFVPPLVDTYLSHGSTASREREARSQLGPMQPGLPLMMVPAGQQMMQLDQRLMGAHYAPRRH